MIFNSNEWCLNLNLDLIFNINTYKTIRKRIWHDKNVKNSNENTFIYFSLHELNNSQPVAYLFSSIEDANIIHPNSSNNNFSIDLVDYQIWNEIKIFFQHGFCEDKEQNINDYSPEYILESKYR